MDVSFLLPTNRDSKYASNVIHSINKIQTDFKYEILLYSKESIDQPNISWLEEKAPLGPIYAFNAMANEAKGKYVICMVDDHIAEDNIFNAITFLESDEFKDKRFRIISLSPGDNNFAHIPKRGDTWCGGIVEVGDVPQFNTMRFPVISKETIDKELNGFIFHPGFRYHAADIWLGYFLGVNGEPGIQYEGARIHEYENLRNWKWEQIDCQYYHTLVYKHRNLGYTEYV